MKTLKNVVPAVALLASAGLASAAEPPLRTVDAERVRDWVSSRGAEAEKTETVEVDLVFNFMKGVGCSDEDAKAAADAAARRANEILKGACVKVNVKEINNDWEGDGNEDDPDTPDVDEADGIVDETELRKAKKDGLKEVTGENDDGTTKKGYKVFIVKDFTGGDLDDAIGCTIKCEPWTAIQKNAEGTNIGETLAHEIGHSFGKLDDTYEDDDSECLMYGYAEEDSELKLKEGEGDKIRDGAKKHGRTVKKDTVAPDDAPKQPEPKADGGISKRQSEPIVNPAGEAVYGMFVAPSFLAPEATDTIIDFTLVRNPGETAPTFIHMGIDMDGDPATGVLFGPWEGVETYIQIFFDPFEGLAQMQVQDLIGGGFFAGPVMVMQSELLPDEFMLPGAPPVAPIQIEELQLSGLMPLDAFPFVIGPQPAFVSGFVSPQPDPMMLPLPQDDPFQFPILPDDFFGQPIVVAPGFALPGDVIPIDGFGFPPLIELQICIDDTPVGVVMSDPNGAFNGLPLPLPPDVFGADGLGYNFISVKADAVGPAGTTWVEAPVPSPCPADLDGDGFVGAGDLAILLAAWGNPATGGADLDGNGFVGVEDLAILLAAWGPCTP